MRRLNKLLFSGVVSAILLAAEAQAVEVNFVSGSVGRNIELIKELVKPWEKKTGNTVNIVPMPSSTSDQFAQYRLWLSAHNADVDVYQTDVIWAPQLADQFVDLSEAAKDVIGEHFPSIVESQTVDGKLVAMPFFTAAPALYYRKDLLEKYDASVPKTWQELTAVAQKIQDAERIAGNKDMWGYVWQGKAYEGLTCDALEWVKSSGGGQIVEADGSISINNPQAAAAIDLAAGWVNTVSPPGVLSYAEEESRGVWQLGNAVFMRNWPYAYDLSNSADSKVKGKFDVAPLPGGGDDSQSAATLGGWNLAVSRYAKHQDEAISLVMFLTSTESQKQHALQGSKLPTIMSLYDDADIKAKQPIIPRWKAVFQRAVPRPSAITKIKYNEVSARFWSAVHDTLAGNGDAAENLEVLEIDLQDLKGNGW